MITIRVTRACGTKPLTNNRVPGLKVLGYIQSVPTGRRPGTVFTQLLKVWVDLAYINRPYKVPSRFRRIEVGSPEAEEKEPARTTGRGLNRSPTSTGGVTRWLLRCGVRLFRGMGTP